MKNQILSIALLIGTLLVEAPASAQTVSQDAPQLQDGTHSQDKTKVLSDINNTLDNATKANEQAAAKLEAKAAELAAAIKTTRDAEEKVNLLTKRLKVLEDKQDALDKNELLVYQANFQSAMVNLISMDKEIKPLNLFNSTRDFYSSLETTANPTNYDGYKEFLTQFKAFIGKEKDKEASFAMIGNLLTLTQDLANGIPFGGPTAQALISNAATFVNTLGNQKKVVRQQGEKMLLLTAKTAQFAYEKGLIEDQHAVLEKELDELQKQYNYLLATNLTVLAVSPADVATNFSNQPDADKRYNYLTTIKEKAGAYVASTRATTLANVNTVNSEWKNGVYKQMVSVQQLKSRFGTLLIRMKENMNQYQQLLDRYKDDPQLGSRIIGLDSSLKKVQANFEDVFAPAAYVVAAQEMYKVM